MIINGFKIIRAIMLTIPFVMMSLRLVKNNPNQEERAYQFIVPIVAFIYCFITMFFIDKIIDIIIMCLLQFINFFSGMLSFIPGIGGILKKVSRLLYLGTGIQLIANTMLVGLFCSLKKNLLPLLKNYWTKIPVLFEETSALFYEKDKNHNYLVLKSRYVYFRTFMYVLFLGTVFLGALDCVLSIVMPQVQVFSYPSFPVFSIIILGEIYSFLNGKIQQEKSKESHNNSEKEEKRETVEYKKLRETLKRMFGDRICYDSDEEYKKPYREEKDYIGELSYSEDRLERIVGNYFEHVRKSDQKIENDQIAAVNKLIHHESVIIYNPFYKDFLEYLLLPMFHELLNHNKCLIISGRITEEFEIKQWIEEAILQTTNLKKLWKIEFLEEESNSSKEEADIGILSFRDIYNLKKMEKNQSFFEKTTMIILIEPSNLLGTGQIGLRCILQQCERDDKDITYCAFDKNCDGLVDALSHVVRKSITEVIASPAADNDYSQIFWRAEGPGMHNRILPKISHYLGFGTEIAALALKEGMEDIHWYSSSKIPLVDLRWIVGQYYKQICDYGQCRIEQSELDTRLHFHCSLWNHLPQKDIFLLVEDEFCNLFEMGRMFSSRIKDKGFVNVLSENYMMRDYMCSNGELFSNDPKAVPAIVPDYVRTERNFILRTIMMLAVSPQDETTLHKELLIHGCEKKDVYQAVFDLIEKYTDLSGDILQITYQEEFDSKLNTMVSKKYFFIDGITIERIFHSDLRPAYYIVENEKHEKYHMGNRLMGHVEQEILPGQFFTFEGKYYQVRSITKEKGIIARRSGDQLSGRTYYRQLREYRLKETLNISNNDPAKDFHGMKLYNLFADIEVYTGSYVELKSGNDLKDASYVELEYGVERKINAKEVMKVILPNSTQEIRFGLCVLINELFRSLYPGEYPYIVAMTEIGEDNVCFGPEQKTLVPTISIEFEKKQNAIYLIEDSCIDLGLLVSVERNLQRIFEIITDYLDWYMEYQAKESTSKTVLGNQVAATDVEGEEEEQWNDSYKKEEYQPYFHWGYDNQPEWMKLKEVLDYLIGYDFLKSNIHRFRVSQDAFDEGSTYAPNEPGTHYCDFCGSILEVDHYDILKDGRERCPECSKTAVKSVKQFRKIYTETLQEMEEIFHIDINVPVKVRMANARKVNEHFGFKPTRHFDARAIGYAKDTGKGYQLYIENGAPIWSTKTTIVHELTHIWQYTNWDMENILNLYGQEERQEIVEGMAVWTEVQYLLCMKEKERAIRYKKSRDLDLSEYGRGMKKYLKKYPAVDNGKLKKTPFQKYPPL